MCFKNKIQVIIVFLLLAFYVPCNGQTKTYSEDDYNKLEKYLLEISDTLLLEKFDAILYLSERNCPVSTKEFASAIEANAFNKENVLIILNAKGRQINIKPYLSGEYTNVVTDFGLDFYRLNFFLTSGIILLKDKKIDKVIEMIADETLEENLEIIYGF